MWSKRIVLSVLFVGVLGIAVSVAAAFTVLPAGDMTTEVRPAIVLQELEDRALELELPGEVQVVTYDNGCPPGGNCPPGFDRRLAIDHPADHNEDGFVCEKTTPSGERAVIDNCVHTTDPGPPGPEPLD